MSGSEQDRDRARRSTHVEHEVVYAAVGASADTDLMRFPPEGSTPYEDGRRLGSGSDRFLVASNALMTWGAPRGAGLEVTEIEAGDGDEYAGVVFDEHGTPQPVPEGDVEYGPDGEPYLTAGTTVTLVRADGRRSRRMRVVYTINEARRVGYAWGSADEQDVVGEEVITVEHRDDDTVWATVRGFMWPAQSGIFGLKGKAAIREAVSDAQALLAALMPGVLSEPLANDGVGDGGDASDGDGAERLEETIVGPTEDPADD